MRKDRGLVKAEQYEEKGLHPKSWLWVPEMKTTGSVKQVSIYRWRGSLELVVFVYSLPQQIISTAQNFFLDNLPHMCEQQQQQRSP